MLIPRDPAHYLGTLKTTTIPKRLLWLECATSHSKEGGLHVQRFESAALGRTWFTSRLGNRKDVVDTYDTALWLWRAVDEYCQPNRRVVLWAYDLAIQLRVSQGLLHLPKLGWRIDRIVLERHAAWALFRHGNRTLLMCDLKSWVNVEFGRLVSEVGEATGTLFTFTAGPTMQSERCLARVQVIRASVLQILKWIEGENLGQFRPTGSGQSYAAYRRRFLSCNLLVHDDPARLCVERVAMWTGRCEAWQHGLLCAGPYVEYDMQAAYCRIAAECEVPAVAEPERRPQNLDRLLARADSYAILAHVTITTDVPIAPTRLGGRTLWPVGTFSTWLWDPELTLVAQYAQSVKVHKVYTYRKAPAVQGFAKFVLAGLSDPKPPYGPIPALALKHWSRCLVGRLGLRYRAWVPFGEQPEPDLRLTTFVDCEDRTSTDMLIAGRERMILADMSEAPESLPQIPSWVMSECRRRLWDAMTTCGLDRIVYVDTDSIIMRAEDEPLRTQRGHGTVGEAWAVKGAYKSLIIHGPRNLQKDSDRVVAGLPLSARQVAPLEFTGEVMKSIKESMKNGELDCVASIPRRFVLNAPDLRRQHLDNHTTAPYLVQLPQGED